ncbi:rab escort protein 1 [Selaginella moellendorffii]|uniref:rab escort protein 1 n=1 Tax=Selaginella moellendorffii TaxID=88036 RepID=UPI000D1C7374|nr:rab escort protein 1 [Selaginella moellendorffii]|eukprot:XP_024532569.1 rab escort protein 1 [Selaginella moellendorffii]
MDIDPDRFDAIVVGTGLPESILAAAAACSGRKVLHLDSNEFYGSEWASMTLDQLSSFIASLGACNGSAAVDSSAELDALGLEESELLRDEFLYSDGKVCEFEGSAAALGSSRDYTLDIAAPKVLRCAESLVDLLIKCGASNYLEFKGVQATYIWSGDGFISAPTSSSELFQDRSLALRDKRRLMRFLKSVQAYISQEGDGAGFSDENLKVSFVELLEREQLPQSIQSIILYAVALLDEDQKASSSPISALKGLQLLKLHMASIGRFDNNGAFLYTLYGQAEIPQAFCRVAAVHGALYVLRMPVTSVIRDKETKQFKGIRAQSGQLLYSDKIVLGASFNKWGSHLVEEMQRPDSKTPSLLLGRYVCITDTSLLSGKSNLLLIFPPRSVSGECNPNPVRVLQLGSTAVCPDGKYVIQISTVAGSGSVAKAALDGVVKLLLFQSGSEEDLTSILEPDLCKPKLLWSGFFTEKLHSTSSQVIDNRIGVCAQPGPEAGYESVVEYTEKVFHQLFGNEEWFASKPELETVEEE